MSNIPDDTKSVVEPLLTSIAKALSLTPFTVTSPLELALKLAESFIIFPNSILVSACSCEPSKTFPLSFALIVPLEVKAPLKISYVLSFPNTVISFSTVDLSAAIDTFPAE